MTLIEEIKNAAAFEADAYLKQNYDGVDDGPCGFAWVNIVPKHKGNTKDGKAERVAIRAMGFELDYTGKRFMMWNPSGNGCQNMDAKLAGARVAARMLREHGFDADAFCRYD